MFLAEVEAAPNGQEESILKLTNAPDSVLIKAEEDTKLIVFAERDILKWQLFVLVQAYLHTNHRSRRRRCRVQINGQSYKSALP